MITKFNKLPILVNDKTSTIWLRGTTENAKTVTNIACHECKDNVHKALIKLDSIKGIEKD